MDIISPRADSFLALLLLGSQHNPRGGVSIFKGGSSEKASSSHALKLPQAGQRYGLHVGGWMGVCVCVCACDGMLSSCYCVHPFLPYHFVQKLPRKVKCEIKSERDGGTCERPGAR